MSFFGDVCGGFKSTNGPHAHERRTEKGTEIGKPSGMIGMGEKEANGVSFADHGHNKKQKPDNDGPQDFGDDRKIIHEARQANAEVIDQGCEDQSGNGSEHHVAIGVGQTEKGYQVACQRVGDPSHSGDELNDHDPSGPPGKALTGEGPRPLVSIAREGDLASELGKDHSDQELAGADDEPSPDEGRATSAKSVTVIGKETGSNADDGEAEGEAGEIAEVAAEFLTVPKVLQCLFVSRRFQIESLEARSCN